MLNSSKMSSFNTDDCFLYLFNIITFYLSPRTCISEAKIGSCDIVLYIFKGSLIKISDGSFYMTVLITVSIFSSAGFIFENVNISSLTRSFELLIPLQNILCDFK